MPGRLSLIPAVALAALFAVPAAAPAPPPAGLVVPGKSLGGLSLGASRAQVRAAWGPRYAVCRDCSALTWYFNYRRFEPQGTGVSFRRGHAVALFTIWSPPGWHTNRSLRIGEPAARIAGVYGPLLRRNCGTYAVSTLRRGRTITSFYIVDETVWGFGVSRLGERICR